MNYFFMLPFYRLLILLRVCVCVCVCASVYSSLHIHVSVCVHICVFIQAAQAVNGQSVEKLNSSSSSSF